MFKYFINFFDLTLLQNYWTDLHTAFCKMIWIFWERFIALINRVLISLYHQIMHLIVSSLCLYFILFSFQIDVVSLTKHLSLLTKNLKTHEFEVNI